MELEIRALLQEAGVSFKTNSKSFICACPRCNKRDKLYIRRKDGRFICWTCGDTDGFQGKPEYALSELCAYPLSEIKKRLYGNSAPQAVLWLDLEVGDFGAEDDGYIDIAPVLKEVIWPLDFVDLDNPLAKRGSEYLEGRGIPVPIAQEYGIKYHPAAERVIFPVQSGKKLYGWQGRLITPNEPWWDRKTRQWRTLPKSLTSENCPKDKVVMFGDRLSGHNHCILTEGPIDAIKAHLCGGNVAAMGKYVSPAQLQLIRNSGVERLYLGLDPDAYLEINRIRDLMKDMVVYDLRPPASFSDLGEMTMEQVKILFDQAPVLHPGQLVIYLKNMFGAPHG